jgi:hypothetical protein
LTKDPLPAYWSVHRDGPNVSAIKKVSIDAAGEPPPEDEAAAAAWERLDEMRREVGKDAMPDVWAVDPKRVGVVASLPGVRLVSNRCRTSEKRSSLLTLSYIQADKAGIHHVDRTGCHQLNVF